MSISDTIKNAQGMVDKVLDLADCIESIDVSKFVNRGADDYLQWMKSLVDVVTKPHNHDNIRSYAEKKLNMLGIEEDNPGYVHALLDATEEATMLRMNRYNKDRQEPQAAWHTPKDPYSGNTEL